MLRDQRAKVAGLADRGRPGLGALSGPRGLRRRGGEVRRRRDAAGEAIDIRLPERRFRARENVEIGQRGSHGARIGEVAGAVLESDK